MRMAPGGEYVGCEHVGCEQLRLRMAPQAGELIRSTD